MPDSTSAPSNGNNRWMARCRDWLSFIALCGAVIAGLWLVLRPAVDSQYLSAAKGYEMRQDLAGLESRFNQLDTRLARIEGMLDGIRSKLGVPARPTPPQEP